MKDVIHAVRAAVNQRGIPYVPFDDMDVALLQSGVQIVPATADKVVDHPDFRGSRVEELINDRTSDKTGATRHQATRPCEVVHFSSWMSIASLRSRVTRAGTPAAMAYSGTSCVTTAPAPTIECAPTYMPGRMLAFIPISAP